MTDARNEATPSESEDGPLISIEEIIVSHVSRQTDRSTSPLSNSTFKRWQEALHVEAELISLAARCQMEVQFLDNLFEVAASCVAQLHQLAIRSRCNIKMDLPGDSEQSPRDY